MPFYDRRIEAVILTHNQADHKNGLAFVQERYNVLQFEPILRRGDKLKLGKMEFEVLSPDSRILGYSTVGKENNEGIVGMVKFGDFDALLTADVATKFYEGGAGVDVVKVPHHGSKTEWNGEWWKKVRPKLAVISVGKNSYGHPTAEVTETLRDLGIKLLRTDEMGDIEVISDGVKWWVK
jgi:competence protein ComEC